LLCGYPPFFDEDNLALFEKIKTGRYDFPSPVWDQVSSEAKEIIRNLLIVDPSKRWTCDYLLKHPWILGETSDDRILKRVVHGEN
jgi:calcium/calmodulin-dependent protein kinase I